MPVETVTTNEDGSRTHIFYKLNESGQTVKVTRTYKPPTLVFKKFGDSVDLPDGPDANSTSIGENVFLKLSRGTVKVRLFLSL